MRRYLRAILAGAAAIMTAGVAAPARARNNQAHVLTIQLPTGGIEQIQYSGNVPPRVILSPAPLMVPVFGPDPGLGRAFAALERISAVLDEEVTRMVRQAADLRREPSPGYTGLRLGLSGTAVVSTYFSDGVCTRSTLVTYAADGAEPRTVSNILGKCGPDDGAQIPEQLSVPTERHGPVATPGTIRVRDSGKTRHTPMLREAVFHRGRDETPAEVVPTAG